MIKSFEPTIRRRFVPNLTPDPFLRVQTRLITWQISQTKSHMGPYKQVNFVALMPSGSVHIKPDGTPSKSAIKILQTGNESLSIPLRPPDHPSSTQQWGNPSKQIQPLTMLAGGRNAQTLSSFRPPDPQPRMKRKSRLVLKNDRLLRSQPPEFFLRPDGIAWPLHSSLEDTYIRPPSVDTPIDASTTGFGEPSTLSQTVASNGPPRWDHPIELAATRIPRGVCLNLPLIAAELGGLAAVDALVASRAPRPLPLDHSLDASRGLSFGASTLTRRRPTPDADPPVSAIEPQSLSPYWLPGLAVPCPVDAPCLLLGALTLRSGFSWKHCIMI